MTNIEEQALIDCIKKVGLKIIEIYSKDFTVQQKKNNSPLTEADLLADKLICEFLIKNYPKYPILSEESKIADYSERKNWNCFWCLDPLDGTKEFVHKTDEFSICLALIENNQVIFGIVHAPKLEVTYYAAKNSGAFKINSRGNISKIQSVDSINEKSSISVAISRFHKGKSTTDWINDNYPDKTIALMEAGSALKICYVAEGKCDLYPRLGPTMEWDTAAAQIIAIEAGRNIYQLENRELELEYNKENLTNPAFIVI